MRFTSFQLARIAKRINEAAGYLELGMAQHALDRLEGLGDLGPLEPQVNLLKGEALRFQHRYQDAAKSFINAAVKTPFPHNRAVWLASSVCYREAGDMQRAIQSLARARGARLSRSKPKPQ